MYHMLSILQVTLVRYQKCINSLINFSQMAHIILKFKKNCKRIPLSGHLYFLNISLSLL
jgi:hypothetical protein